MNKTYFFYSGTVPRHKGFFSGLVVQDFPDPLEALSSAREAQSKSFGVLFSDIKIEAFNRV